MEKTIARLRRERQDRQARNLQACRSDGPLLKDTVMPIEPTPAHQDPLQHPMYPVVMAAIEQAMFGKGKRHGGAETPWLEQPIFHYAKMHGRGFLTGQAAKKLEEAATTRAGTAFETEVLGAIVYACAAIVYERMLDGSDAGG